jgi:hypothetical protein
LAGQKDGLAKDSVQFFQRRAHEAEDSFRLRLHATEWGFWDFIRLANERCLWLKRDLGKPWIGQDHHDHVVASLTCPFGSLDDFRDVGAPEVEAVL